MGLKMSERKAVTREYRPRYQKAGKKEKTAILDEFTRLTGYHRKHACRILGRNTPYEFLVYTDGGAVKVKVAKNPRPANRQGRRKYDAVFVEQLRRIWKHYWYKCGTYLAPIIRQQIDEIEGWKGFKITPEIKSKLVTISPAHIDRLLVKDKAELRLKGESLTKPIDGLLSRIPVRSYYSAEEKATPGYLQVDTVHHCGRFTVGEYLLTLSAVDVESGWINFYSLLNKAFKWCFEGLADIKKTLPFPLIEFHPDNGGEFINHATEEWCIKEGISLTRSRSYKKNDNCFVEQKNGAVVRNYIGYDRLEGEADRDRLASIYRDLVPLLNFFMPTRRLISKVRVGSKEIKKYDKPKTPYLRIMESSKVSQEIKDNLKSMRNLYNPVQLQENVNMAILHLRQSLAQKRRPLGGG